MHYKNTTNNQGTDTNPYDRGSIKCLRCRHAAAMTSVVVTLDISVFGLPQLQSAKSPEQLSFGRVKAGPAHHSEHLMSTGRPSLQDRRQAGLVNDISSLPYKQVVSGLCAGCILLMYMLGNLVCRLFALM